MPHRITIPIADIKIENDTVRTFYFEYDLSALPGQFIMLTDFRNGEKPFSISECEVDYFAVTIKKIGIFTQNLFTKELGEMLSFRGPYGSSFTIKSGKCLVIGGGYATPPLYFLCKELLRKKADITIINGARSLDNLLFCRRFQKLEALYERITDSGCLGTSGTSADAAKEYLVRNKYDMIYVSGPELMMYALRDILAEYPDTAYEFLFERYMKCAIGICGNCTIDPLGIRLCVEGPVLPRDMIEKLTEFGKYHRDAAGSKQYY